MFVNTHKFLHASCLKIDNFLAILTYIQNFISTLLLHYVQMTDIFLKIYSSPQLITTILRLFSLVPNCISITKFILSFIH